MKGPARSAGQFSKREIVLFILVMIVATLLTIEGTHYILKTFVLVDPRDPLTKAGGLSPMQEQVKAKGK